MPWRGPFCSSKKGQVSAGHIRSALTCLFKGLLPPPIAGRARISVLYIPLQKRPDLKRQWLKMPAWDQRDARLRMLMHNSERFSHGGWNRLTPIFHNFSLSVLWLRVESHSLDHRGTDGEGVGIGVHWPTPSLATLVSPASFCKLSESHYCNIVRTCPSYTWSSGVWLFLNLAVQLMITKTTWAMSKHSS